MIESHNRERFSIYAYSTGPDYNDEMRVRLKNTFEYFRDLHGQTEEAIAQIIYGDEIDILVDLKGYTAENSAIALSYRPAPVQVNYLGFPGTMGAEFMDYILVDDYLVPPEQASFYTEKLVYLPGCYQVNDSTRKAASPIPTRTELGLPEQGFVFCCFNNNYKISPRMYDVWMRLLQRVPDSVLWLMIGNKHAIPNLQREAEARGVAKDRIFFADTVKLEQHLARISRADLFLDTFPVNAHTTASDALWAGCPLVTLSGETFISRVAGSLLTTLGLSELIACDYDDYESIACRCATDPAWFADIRQRLKNGRSTSDLFQGAAFAKKIEAAFEQMWQIYNAGESPRSIRVPPLSA
jgi:predicted O-linked N-acetylglucosamine transferase (SPINDLY family)